MRKRLPRAAKLALFAATLALGILFTGSSLSPVIFPVQQIQARFVAAPPPPVAPPADTAPRPPAVPQPPGLDPALFKGGRGLPLSRAFDLGVKTILLDPGHGGEDTGAIGRGGTREKEIALDIARRLKRRLECAPPPRCC